MKDLMPTEPQYDNEVISKVIQGQKDLYERIIRKYNPRLYRVAMSIVKDQEEAEEIMQIAYIKAYENLEKFEGKSSFSTWLTRILINEGLQMLKNKKRHEVMDWSDMKHDKKNIDNTNPLGQVMNEELKIILERSIEQLPDKYRTVFVMRELENMSIAETMGCLGLTESNVKVRLNRAKEMLRESLSEYYRYNDIYSFHLSRCNRIVEKVFQKINQNVA
jgi:RNA polymerase sigma factor (sigma-70 family)